MAFDDLRSFLHALDQQGQLLKISEECQRNGTHRRWRARAVV